MQKWQARQKARELWGPSGDVEETDAGCYVGIGFPNWFGWGLTFEEAFKDAEKRKKK
jgi:hypothetical protein